MDSLTFPQTLLVAIVIVVGLLAVGAVVIWARKASVVPDKSSDSVIRSWIAMGLVLGLLVLCVLAFAVQDTTLRSTLIGGLMASVGAAIAFYFSAKSGEQARKDMMSVMVGTESVPDLKGMTMNDALAAMGGTSLKLKVDPVGSPENSTYVVQGQDPVRNSTIPKGSPVTVKFGPPSPQS